MPKTINIFVYGTLMRGEVSAHRLANASFVQTDKTRPDYTLLDLGWHPALMPDGDTAVDGEIYVVNDTQLSELDAYERCPKLYRRETICLQSGVFADTYILAHPQSANGVPISNGDWRSWNAAR